MGHACTHDEFPGPGSNGNKEHPVVAVIAIIAIIAAILLITWVRFEVHGTEDIEAALTETPAQGDVPAVLKPDLRPDEEREVDAAVTSSRFATGFSP
jgi:hypothetical protein